MAEAAPPPTSPTRDESPPELTENFQFYVRFAKPLVLNLEVPNERVLAAAWLRKLCDAGSGDEKVRTDYLKLLLFVMQKGRLFGPFAKNPTSTTITELGMGLRDVAKAWLETDDAIKRRRNALGLSAELPAVTAECSSDLTEYSAAQEIPNFGIHAYYAFSNDPITAWLNLERGIFPKGALSAIKKSESAGGLGDQAGGRGARGKETTLQQLQRRARSKTRSRSTSRSGARGSAGDTSDGSRRVALRPGEKGRISFISEGHVHVRSSSPLGSPMPKQDRQPPTWGSNLISVSDLPPAPDVLDARVLELRQTSAAFKASSQRSIPESGGSKGGSGGKPGPVRKLTFDESEEHSVEVVAQTSPYIPGEGYIRVETPPGQQRGAERIATPVREPSPPLAMVQSPSATEEEAALMRMSAMSAGQFGFDEEAEQAQSDQAAEEDEDALFARMEAEAGVEPPLRSAQVPWVDRVMASLQLQEMEEAEQAFLTPPARQQMAIAAAPPEPLDEDELFAQMEAQAGVGPPAAGGAPRTPRDQWVAAQLELDAIEEAQQASLEGRPAPSPELVPRRRERRERLTARPPAPAPRARGVPFHSEARAAERAAKRPLPLTRRGIETHRVREERPEQVELTPGFKASLGPVSGALPRGPRRPARPGRRARSLMPRLGGRGAPTTPAAARPAGEADRAIEQAVRAGMPAVRERAQDIVGDAVEGMAATLPPQTLEEMRSEQDLLFPGRRADMDRTPPALSKVKKIRDAYGKMRYDQTEFGIGDDQQFVSASQFFAEQSSRVSVQQPSRRDTPFDSIIAEAERVPMLGEEMDGVDDPSISPPPPRSSVLFSRLVADSRREKMITDELDDLDDAYAVLPPSPKTNQLARAMQRARQDIETAGEELPALGGVPMTTPRRTLAPFRFVPEDEDTLLATSPPGYLSPDGTPPAAHKLEQVAALPELSPEAMRRRRAEDGRLDRTVAEARERQRDDRDAAAPEEAAVAGPSKPRSPKARDWKKVKSVKGREMRARLAGEDGAGQAAAQRATDEEVNRIEEQFKTLFRSLAEEDDSIAVCPHASTTLMSPTMEPDEFLKSVQEHQIPSSFFRYDRPGTNTRLYSGDRSKSVPRRSPAPGVETIREAPTWMKLAASEFREWMDDEQKREMLKRVWRISRRMEGVELPEASRLVDSVRERYDLERRPSAARLRVDENLDARTMPTLREDVPRDLVGALPFEFPSGPPPPREPLSPEIDKEAFTAAVSGAWRWRSHKDVTVRPGRTAARDVTVRRRSLPAVPSPVAEADEAAAAAAAQPFTLPRRRLFGSLLDDEPDLVQQREDWLRRGMPEAPAQQRRAQGIFDIAEFITVPGGELTAAVSYEDLYEEYGPTPEPPAAPDDLMGRRREWLEAGMPQQQQAAGSAPPGGIFDIADFVQIPGGELDDMGDLEDLYDDYAPPESPSKGYGSIFHMADMIDIPGGDLTEDVNYQELIDEMGPPPSPRVPTIFDEPVFVDVVDRLGDEDLPEDMVPLRTPTAFDYAGAIPSIFDEPIDEAEIAVTPSPPAPRGTEIISPDEPMDEALFLAEVDLTVRDRQPRGPYHVMTGPRTSRTTTLHRMSRPDVFAAIPEEDEPPAEYGPARRAPARKLQRPALHAARWSTFPMPPPTPEPPMTATPPRFGDERRRTRRIPMERMPRRRPELTRTPPPPDDLMGVRGFVSQRASEPAILDEPTPLRPRQLRPIRPRTPGGRMAPPSHLDVMGDQMTHRRYGELVPPPPPQEDPADLRSVLATYDGTRLADDIDATDFPDDDDLMPESPVYGMDFRWDEGVSILPTPTTPPPRVSPFQLKPSPERAFGPARADPGFRPRAARPSPPSYQLALQRQMLSLMTDDDDAIVHRPLTAVPSTSRAATPPRRSPTPPRRAPTPPRRAPTPPRRSPTPPRPGADVMDLWGAAMAGTEAADALQRQLASLMDEDEEEEAAAQAAQRAPTPPPMPPPPPPPMPPSARGRGAPPPPDELEEFERLEREQGVTPPCAAVCGGDEAAGGGMDDMMAQAEAQYGTLRTPEGYRTPPTRQRTPEPVLESGRVRHRRQLFFGDNPPAAEPLMEQPDVDILPRSPISQMYREVAQKRSPPTITRRPMSISTGRTRQRTRPLPRYSYAGPLAAVSIPQSPSVEEAPERPPPLGRMPALRIPSPVASSPDSPTTFMHAVGAHEYTPQRYDRGRLQVSEHPRVPRLASREYRPPEPAVAEDISGELDEFYGPVEEGELIYQRSPQALFSGAGAFLADESPPIETETWRPPPAWPRPSAYGPVMLDVTPPEDIGDEDKEDSYREPSPVVDSPDTFMRQVREHQFTAHRQDRDHSLRRRLEVESRVRRPPTPALEETEIEHRDPLQDELIYQSSPQAMFSGAGAFLADESPPIETETFRPAPAWPIAFAPSSSMLNVTPPEDIRDEDKEDSYRAPSPEVDSPDTFMRQVQEHQFTAHRQDRDHSLRKRLEVETRVRRPPTPALEETEIEHRDPLHDELIYQSSPQSLFSRGDLLIGEESPPIATETWQVRRRWPEGYSFRDVSQTAAPEDILIDSPEATRLDQPISSLAPGAPRRSPGSPEHADDLMRELAAHRRGPRDPGRARDRRAVDERRPRAARSVDRMRAQYEEPPYDSPRTIARELKRHRPVPRTSGPQLWLRDRAAVDERKPRAPRAAPPGGLASVYETEPEYASPARRSPPFVPPAVPPRMVSPPYEEEDFERYRYRWNIETEQMPPDDMLPSSPLFESRQLGAVQPIADTEFPGSPGSPLDGPDDDCSCPADERELLLPTSPEERGDVFFFGSPPTPGSPTAVSPHLMDRLEQHERTWGTSARSAAARAPGLSSVSEYDENLQSIVEDRRERVRAYMARKREREAREDAERQRLEEERQQFEMDYGGVRGREVFAESGRLAPGGPEVEVNFNAAGEPILDTSDIPPEEADANDFAWLA